MLPLPLGENVLGMKILAPSQSTNTVILSIDLQPPGFRASTVYSVVALGCTVTEGALLYNIPGAVNQYVLVTSAEMVGVMVMGEAPFSWLCLFLHQSAEWDKL